MKLDLLTNDTVVNDAMRFVSDYSNYNKKSISKQDSQESKEPDYNDEDFNKQGKEEQKEKTEEITKEQNQTNYQVF